ncbi:hypothetical protein ACLMAB_09790 [Brevibacillus laterosporus]
MSLGEAPIPYQRRTRSNLWMMRNACQTRGGILSLDALVCDGCSGELIDLFNQSGWTSVAPLGVCRPPYINGIHRTEEYFASKANATCPLSRDTHHEYSTPGCEAVE